MVGIGRSVSKSSSAVADGSGVARHNNFHPSNPESQKSKRKAHRLSQRSQITPATRSKKFCWNCAEENLPTEPDSEVAQP